LVGVITRLLSIKMVCALAERAGVLAEVLAVQRTWDRSGESGGDPGSLATGCRC